MYRNSDEGSLLVPIVLVGLCYLGAIGASIFRDNLDLSGAIRPRAEKSEDGGSSAAQAAVAVVEPENGRQLPRPSAPAFRHDHPLSADVPTRTPSQAAVENYPPPVASRDDDVAEAIPASFPKDREDAPLQPPLLRNEPPLPRPESPNAPVKTAARELDPTQEPQAEPLPAAPPAKCPLTLQPQAITLEFDKKGQVISAVDDTGWQASWEYDDCRRVTTQRTPRDTVRFGYDAFGNPTSIADSTGRTEYKYDALNRLAAMTFRRSPPMSVEYSYDPWDRVREVSVRNAAGQKEYVVSLDHDAFGQLRSIDDGHSRITYDYRYQAGQIVRTLPDGTKTTFAYSPTGQLTGIRHDAPEGRLISQEEYRLDLAHDRLSITQTLPHSTASQIFTSPLNRWAESPIRVLAPPGSAIPRSEFQLTPTPPGVALPRNLPGMIHDGTGAIVGRQEASGTTHLLKAPLGTHGRLLGEYHDDGRLSRVILIGDRLAVEHQPGVGSTTYLERGLGSPAVLAATRILTGQSPEPQPHRQLLVSDHGIQQYDRQDFNFAFDHHLIYRLPSASNKDPSYYKDQTTVKREIYSQFQDYLEKHPEATDIELRLVQDVNIAGHFTGHLPWSHAQERADERARWALEAVGQLKNDFHLRTVLDAGSDAGRWYTRALQTEFDQGRRPIDHVRYDDAQVQRGEVEQLMRNLGPERFSFFAERGGFHGSLESWGIPTRPIPGEIMAHYSRGDLVANPQVLEELNRQFPGTQVFRFNPPGPIDQPFKSHLYAVEHPAEAIPAEKFNPQLGRFEAMQPTRPVDLLGSRPDGSAYRFLPELRIDRSLPGGPGRLPEFDSLRGQLAVRPDFAGGIPPWRQPQAWAPRRPLETTAEFMDRFASTEGAILGLGNELAGSPFFEGLDIGLTIGQDIIAFQNDRRDLAIRFLEHGVLGGTSEWASGEYVVKPFVEQLAGKYSLWGGLSGEATGLAYDLARGHRSLADPNVAEHVLDSVFGASVYGLVMLVSEGNTVAASRAAAIAVKVPDFGRVLTAPAFDAAGLHLGTTGRGIAGDWIWSAARAAETGTSDQFFSGLGSRSLDTTVRLWAPWLHGSFQEFDDAARRGNYAKMADMLRHDPHIRSQLGFSDKDVEIVAGRLDARAGIERVPGLDLDQSQQRLGGIKLEAKAEFRGELGRIEALVFDRQSGRLVLVGDGDPALPAFKPECLAIAFLCVFGSQPFDPQFSLDPADETNPNGPWLKAKYIPDEYLRGTDFGKIMFEADWVMKQYGFGVVVDADGTLRDRVTKVAGFQSQPEILFSDPSLQPPDQSNWARFWITSERMLLGKALGAVQFEEAKMKILAKKQVPGPDGRLQDVETEDPVAAKFAAQFTPYYDGLAQESPALLQVRELAKAIALAKWLKEHEVQVKIDVSWIEQYAARRVPTVDRISAIAHQKENKKVETVRHRDRIERRTSVHTVRVFGGVDLTVQPEYGEDRRRVAQLRDAVGEAVAGNLNATSLELQIDGKLHRCLVLPFTPAGLELWKAQNAIEKSGVAYVLNPQGRVATASDRAGSRAEYEYDASGQLIQVTIREPDQTIATARRMPQGTAIEVTTPTAHRFSYELGSGRELRRVKVDGELLACIEREEPTRTVRIRYAAGPETMLTYGGPGGRLTHYKMVTPSGDGVVREEEVALAYDSKGQLTEIASAQFGSVKVKWDAQRIRFIETPRRKCDYTYDADGELSRMVDSAGSAWERTTTSDGASQVQFTCPDASARMVCRDGRLESVTDFSGRTAAFRYDQQQRMAEVLGSGDTAARFSYGEEGRLSVLFAPGYGQISFQYNVPPDQNAVRPDAAYRVRIVTAPSADSPAEAR